MANSLGYSHKLYAVRRIRSKKGDDETNCLNHGKRRRFILLWILNNRILNTFLQSGVQLSEERVNSFFLFNFKLVWFKLLQIRGTKLSNGLLAKKKLDILLFKKTDEEIYIDCLFHRRKVLYGKWMVGMYLLSTQSASYDLMCCVTL